jgi:predicted ATP-dependent endonuclease of OLD family
MRGIFYYAGIDARDCQDLFKQTDETDMRLTDASAHLNDTLRDSWKQGEDLQFRLAHRDGTSVELQIRDPSVKLRYVRASRRSAGFTHFFTLKTILHARQVEHPAESYVYLFDEPGVFLHPSGQYDLMRVMEAIGLQDQVVYSTHSLFMVNRTFPLRHRLVSKHNGGTRINAKPYSGRWGATLSSLGVSLTATIMFSDYVLMTEGDSEAILIPAILQRIMGSGISDIDLNSFAVLASGDVRDTQALLRVLMDSASAPSLAILVDGDDGGKARLKALKNFMSTRPSVKSGSLVESTTVEDYLPYLHELYPEAVVRHSFNARVDSGKPSEGLTETIQEYRHSFELQFPVGKLTSGVAKWGSDAGEKIIGDGKPPSKVGIAREYIALLDQKNPSESDPTGMKRPKRLLATILEMLSLPRLAEVSDTVLVDQQETP